MQLRSQFGVCDNLSCLVFLALFLRVGGFWGGLPIPLAWAVRHRFAELAAPDAVPRNPAPFVLAMPERL